MEERRHDGRVAIATLAALMLVVPACGGSLARADAGAMDAPSDVGVDAPRDVGVDAAADQAGTAIACGNALTCTGTDLCLRLNLCGGPLRCDTPPDGGQCPSGSSLNPNCPNGPACTPNCPGDSYECVPRPAGCDAGIDCSCLGFSFCPFSVCVQAYDRQVFCANQ